MYKQELLSKQGEVTMQLAKLLLTLKVDDRLPSTNELRKEYQAGIGTIQNAIKFFDNNDIITTVSRGHQGTIIKAIDYIALFRYLDPSWMFGAMPLPYSLRLAGLAAGLYSNFDEKDIMLKMSYMRGSRIRISSLISQRFDFIICSKMAAEIAIKDHPHLEILHSFGSDTYIYKSGIIFSHSNQRTIEDGMKIGYDSDSYDQIFLNHLISDAQNVTFVKLKYSEILAKLKSEEIDACVWSSESLKGSGFENHFMLPTDDQMTKSLASCQEAVVLVEKKHYTNNLLKSILETDRIKEIQRDVIAKKIVPFY